MIVEHRSGRPGLPAQDAETRLPGQSRNDTPAILARDLLGEAREVLLIHNGDTYRLRLTSNNKLILTK